MKILMVGQLPPPVTGEGVANGLLLKFFSNDNVHFINSSIIKSANDVGLFSLIKFFKSIRIFFNFVSALPSAEVVYITPGQTVFGLIRFLPMVICARLLMKRVVSHWHGYGVLSESDFHSFLAFMVLKISTENILLTKDLEAKLRNKYPTLSNFHVVNNFSKKPTDGVVSSEIMSDRLKILFLGSLMKEKGIEEFANCATVMPNHDFYICGSGSHEMELFLREKSSNLQNLHFCGPVDGERKWDFFLMADIFVLQTYYRTEGVPLSILEAMSSGCAVLCTKHNGIPEIVGAQDLWLEAKSVSSLRDAIINFDVNRFQLKEAKANNLKMVENFTEENFCICVGNIIKNIKIQ